MLVAKRFLLLILASTIFATTAYAEIVDKIVAVVNDEPITRSELESHFAPIYQQFIKSYEGAELGRKLEEARINVLHQLIEDKLVYQEAKRQEIPIDDEEIESKMEELKSNFPSEEEFLNEMRKQGLNLRNLRDRFREQIAIAKIHKYEILSGIIISPQDIENYYEEHLSDFTESERVRARTIMLRKKPEEEPIEETQKRLVGIIEMLKNGESFSSLAEKYSDESHAADGGNLGFVEKGEMVEAIDNALFQCAVGSATDIVESKIGFHVFLVEAKQEKKVTDLESKRDEINEIIFRERAEARFKEWIKDLKENAYISIK